MRDLNERERRSIEAEPEERPSSSSDEEDSVEEHLQVQHLASHQLLWHALPCLCCSKMTCL